jgi:hypothetical protein
MQHPHTDAIGGKPEYICQVGALSNLTLSIFRFKRAGAEP